MYPIDKTNLDVLRFLHFLSMAVLTVRLVPSNWSLLQSRWLFPAIVCGQHSLEIFCLGRSEEHTSELQSRQYLVCRLLLEKKKKQRVRRHPYSPMSTNACTKGQARREAATL